jgi:hypothetical protein
MKEFLQRKVINFLITLKKLISRVAYLPWLPSSIIINVPELHFVLVVGYNVEQEELTYSFWGSTIVKRRITNFLPFSSKGKHWCISPSLGILFYNGHYVMVIVHLRFKSLLKP